jgi:conjugal transfer/type IV secretion protein DotA/TraY
MLQLFSAFNIVALAVISALFLWVTAVAVTGTAHKGTPFGKRYSSLWMPLRFVGAIGALAPIFKGLSFFQVAILACIGLSVNLGNFVWSLGTDYFVEHGGQITVQAPDQNVTHYSAIANRSLQSLTMQYYLGERRGLNVFPGGNGNTAATGCAPAGNTPSCSAAMPEASQWSAWTTATRSAGER